MGDWPRQRQWFGKWDIAFYLVAIFMIRQLKYGRSTNNSMISLSYATLLPVYFKFRQCPKSTKSVLNVPWDHARHKCSIHSSVAAGQRQRDVTTSRHFPPSSPCFARRYHRPRMLTVGNSEAKKSFPTLLFLFGWGPLNFVILLNQDKTLYCTQRGGRSRRGEISPLLGGGGGEGGGLLQVFSQNEKII